MTDEGRFLGSFAQQQRIFPFAIRTAPRKE
jgi:hypothetical protein